MTSPRLPRYTSRLTAILTLIGVAVGLGNVWRFPYMMGSYGGSAFLAVYLIFTIAFAFPALMAEMALGRATRGVVVVAFTKAAGPRLGRGIAVLLLSTVIIAGSYYAVVIADLVFTTGYSLFIGFEQDNLPQFQSLLGQSGIKYIVTLSLILISFFIIHRGLKRGIERLSTIVVPFFLLVILYLIVYTLSLPGATRQLLAFLRPDFSLMTPTDVFAALGQSFFSVGLGGTFIIVYGSFIKEERSIPRLAIATVFGDLGASLLMSLFLVPAILILGMDLGEDPEYRLDEFWPAEEYEKVFRDVVLKHEKLILPIMQSALQYLNVDPHLYDDRLTKTNFGFRLNYYPPISEEEDQSGAGRMLGHEDVDFFTILPAQDVEGLQVYNRKNGKWIRLNAPKGSIILNTGDYMQRITNDRFPSTTHRVSKPADKTIFNKPRISIPMAVYVWEDEVLEVLPGLGGPHYEPISAIKFHTNTTSKYYGDEYAVNDE